MGIATLGIKTVIEGLGFESLSGEGSPQGVRPLSLCFGRGVLRLEPRFHGQQFELAISHFPFIFPLTNL